MERPGTKPCWNVVYGSRGNRPVGIGGLYSGADRTAGVSARSTTPRSNEVHFCQIHRCSTHWRIRVSLLEIADLTKNYVSPDGERTAVLDVPSFRLDDAEQVALEGGSGSGKTTLLHVIAGIVTPDSGTVDIDGIRVTSLRSGARDRHRAESLGYVFQTFQLLPAFSALENVCLGMAFGSRMDRDRARELLVRLGLGDRLSHRPRQLSIGQQQRVALARALANRPRLVLADEPTGNLDRKNGERALALLREVCREQGAALLLVSHDAYVLEAFERRVDLRELNRAMSPADGHRNGPPGVAESEARS